MTIQYADDEMPFDAVRSLRIMKRGLEVIHNDSSRVNAAMYIEVHEQTICGLICELNKVIADAEAVYAEHADLCKLMKHLNRAVRHYEVED